MSLVFVHKNVLRIFHLIECREYEDAKYEKRYTSVGFNEKPILEKILHCATSNVPLIVRDLMSNKLIYL